MAGRGEAAACEWGCRWQAALVQALGPVRTVTLSRRELLKTGEDGALAVDAALIRGDVALGDEIAASSASTVPSPAPDQDPQTWLRWLASRASTLQERLDTAHMAPAGPADETAVQARLARWACRVGADDDGGAFDRYLERAGLDSFAARRAVGPIQLREGAPLPGWAATLEQALFTPRYDPLPDVCDPVRPIPFEVLLLPFVDVYLRRVRAGSPWGRGRLTPAAEVGLARHLLAALSSAARDALYAEFCSDRLAGFAPLAPFVYPDPDALYRRFVHRMQAGGLIELYEAHPVLARRLATQTDLYAAAVGEFLRRLEADLPEICRLWEIADPGSVTGVAAGLSDPHRGGRQVYAVTLADGSRLIYKPKDLGIDVAYNELLAWLNAAGAPVALRPLRVLDRQGYGWVECVEPAACADRAAAARFYGRAGGLLCLAYLLQGSDCHAENLIAAGEDPVLVDCETLLDPWPRAADQPAGGGARRTRINCLMRDSVLTTDLLPTLGEENERTFSTPGLCRAIILPIRKRTNRWMHINTDHMTVGLVSIRPEPAHNLPYVDGSPADVGEHIEPLVAGFAAMYRFLTVRQTDLLAADGPLAAFRGRFVRFLFRSTHLYGVLSAYAMRLPAQSDGADHSLDAEMLARAFLVSEQTPAGWPILAAERAAVLRGDVPFFGARTDQAALLLEGGERIEEYFTGPSYDAMQAKLRNLSEEDLAFQVGLIRAAIGVYADLLAQASELGPA
jgi:type 2 lantibiotic biosynthesis protein LanM